MNSIDVKKTARLLTENDNILIITHKKPDGDTTGCASGLCIALRKAGKTVYILENPEIIKRYENLIKPFYPKDNFKPDFVVTVDIATTKLFTQNAQQYIGSIDLVIDHHKSNDMFGKRNLVIDGAGACAEIIFEIIEQMGIELDEQIAKPLYVALSTDTGCFKFSNTTANTLKMAAKCVETGIDCGEINRALFEVKSWARLQMECFILQKIEFFNDKKVAVARISRDIIDKTGADMDDLDSIASLTRQIEGVEVGITLIENKDGIIKASVRTTKEVSACEICTKCGGGGHVRASGAMFDKSVDMQRACDMIVNATMEVYEENVRA